MLLAAGFLTAPLAGQGQTLFQVNGNATATSSCSASGFTITPDQSGQGGSVWNKRPVSLATSFAVTGSMYLGTKDANGADGITFTLQNDARGAGATGNSGQNLGVSGISPSVSVEVDTYNNGTAANDIADDHLAIFKSGDVTKYVTFIIPSGGTATVIAAAVNASNAAIDIENGTYYPFKITWDAPSTTLRVYFNNTLRATYSENFVSTVFSSNSLVYWGFTGATGGASNLQQVCSPVFDYDQDNDGVTNTLDLDDDNDGIADLTEAKNVDATGDADNDGIPNYQDADFGTLNSKGVVASLDLDGDGRINQFDPDSDADGIPDVVEGTTGTMPSGFRSIYSAALGQYTSAVDTNGKPTNTSAYTTLPDTDGDGLADYLDTNADNDRIPDWSEGFDDNSDGYSAGDFTLRAQNFVKAGGSSTYYPATDADNNGVSDWLDDADKNGIVNYLDVSSSFFHDTDNDGLVDLLDPTNLGKGYADVSGYPDKNANQVPDYRDATTVTPLPVELVEFTAQAMGAAVQLSWTTASELHAARFEIERSLDGQVYALLGSQLAAGTSATAHTYTYLDAKLPGGSRPYYYRLHQVDETGTAAYSPVRVVLVASAGLTAYPNPARQSVLISGLAPYATVQLLDALGRPVAQVAADEAGQAKLLFAASQPSGVYLLRSGQQVLRLVLE
ncbi:MAG: lectin-like domain-containing protein [Janthinobacterium lividum]